MEKMNNFLRGVYIVWYRDLLRFRRNKTRVVTGFSFPVIWLLIFGNGMSASLSLPVTGFKYVQFLFPGAIAQYLIFNSMGSAISILQDKEFGFLKEVLVSPINRTAIAIGKILGGATTATLQSLTVFVLGPVIGVELNLKMVLLLIPAMFALSLVMSAIGVAVTSRMKSLDAGQYMFQFIAFPIIMLSGAIFPLHNLPVWLDILTKINPITYAVDILRRTVFENLNLPPQVIATLSPTINGNVISVGYELVIITVFTVTLVVLASRAFKNA